MPRRKMLWGMAPWKWGTMMEKRGMGGRLTGEGGEGEGDPDDETAADFGDEPEAAAEGCAECGPGGIFEGAVVHEFGEPGGEEGAEEGSEDWSDDGYGDADDGAGDGAEDGGPGGGFAGAEFFSAEHGACEFDGFGGEEDDEDKEEDDGVGCGPAGEPGDEEGGEGHDPVAGDGEDVECDGGEGEEHEECVEEVVHGGIVAGGWGGGGDKETRRGGDKEKGWGGGGRSVGVSVGEVLGWG